MPRQSSSLSLLATSLLLLCCLLLALTLRGKHQVPASTKVDIAAQGTEREKGAGSHEYQAVFGHH